MAYGRCRPQIPPEMWKNSCLRGGHYTQVKQSTDMRVSHPKTLEPYLVILQEYACNWFIAICGYFIYQTLELSAS